MDKDILSLHTLFVVNVHIIVLFLHFSLVLFVQFFVFYINLQLHPKSMHLSRKSKYALDGGHFVLTERLTTSDTMGQNDKIQINLWITCSLSFSPHFPPKITRSLNFDRILFRQHFAVLKLWDTLPGLRNLRMCLNSEVSQCNALWSSWLQHIPPTLHIEQRRIPDKLLRICILQ